MILIVKEVRQMLIALSRMLVVGHKFGVQGKFKSNHLDTNPENLSQPFFRFHSFF